MKDFAGKFAVVTGGGTGMGRELVRQLAAEGCSVAMCDVSTKNMAETARLCEADRLPQGVKITAHEADVADEAQLVRFRDQAAEQHGTDRLHLLFNNAGIGGGGSFVSDPRAVWERTFNICWGGVYLGTRTFFPMLLRADDAHIVNTSSVNGFWACLGPTGAHTAYAAAKFAVKGFTEALVVDLRMNAPHVKASVVMPGHIGTAIASNTLKMLTGDEEGRLSADELARGRRRMEAMGMDVAGLTDDDLQARAREQARRFEEEAPMSAAQAAKVILDGVKADRWRILVGDDAHQLDAWVRKAPESAYETEFMGMLMGDSGLRIDN